MLMKDTESLETLKFDMKNAYLIEYSSLIDEWIERLDTIIEKERPRCTACGAPVNSSGVYKTGL